MKEKLKLYFKRKGRDSLTGIIMPLWFGRFIEIFWILFGIAILYEFLTSY